MNLVKLIFEKSKKYSLHTLNLSEKSFVKKRLS